MTSRFGRRIRCACAVASLIGIVGCDGSIHGATDLPATNEFVAAGCVQIDGYDGDAMEPFIEPRSGALLFNNSNAKPNLTDLFWAKRIDDGHFTFVGKIEGANSDALDGVPSVDEDGNFYFISTRSYAETYSTIYRGHWSNGSVTRVELVRGVSRGHAPYIDFDAEISRDGDSLYFAEGVFKGGPIPVSADIVMAHRRGDGFVVDTYSDVLLGTVNTPALEYAPAISADRRELFFTRLDKEAHTVGIYRVKRIGAAQPFGKAERVSAADGFVEAPALNPDGTVLYFHRLDAGRFHICRANRVKGNT